MLVFIRLKIYRLASGRFLEGIISQWCNIMVLIFSCDDSKRINPNIMVICKTYQSKIWKAVKVSGCWVICFLPELLDQSIYNGYLHWEGQLLVNSPAGFVMLATFTTWHGVLLLLPLGNVRLLVDTLIVEIPPKILYVNLMLIVSLEIAFCRDSTWWSRCKEQSRISSSLCFWT